MHVQLFQKRLLLRSVMRDARSMFHSRRCTIVDSYCERDNGPQKAETKQLANDGLPSTEEAYFKLSLLP